MITEKCVSTLRERLAIGGKRDVAAKERSKETSDEASSHHSFFLDGKLDEGDLFL